MGGVHVQGVDKVGPFMSLDGEINEGRCFLYSCALSHWYLVCFTTKSGHVVEGVRSSA